MKGEECMDKKTFMMLSTEEVAKIVSRLGKPKTLALIPDGTRKKNIIVDRWNPKSPDFEQRHTTSSHTDFINVLKVFYNCGLETLFLPTVARGNLVRSEKYQGYLIQNALKNILTGEEWEEFFREFDIKVNIYGDLNSIYGLGYPEVEKWIKSVETGTSKHKTRRLLLGLAYGQSVEEVRLAEMAIDFYGKHKKVPSRNDLLRLYYGDTVDYVDILIRPSVVRDSDMQPILVCGRAEMYFPVTSCLLITEEMMKTILYDYLYQRMISFGLKDYSDGVDMSELEFIREYFKINKNAILGIGMRKREGHFWFPIPQIQIPK